MDFNKELKQFSAKLSGIKESIQTEEATKMSMIAPFFQLLGYDIFNPNEFCPEFTADVGIKKGEKVDYAIIKDGHPIILIEAKAINKKLERHDSQLFRYFSTTNARFAILTNGVNYKFFTDLNEVNKMDRETFYEFNMFNLSDEDISEIQKFRKEEFDEEKLIDNAAILKSSFYFKQEFQENLSDPSDEFLKLFLKNFYKGVKTQNVLDRYKPVLKKAMNDYIDELVKKKMTSIVNESGYINATQNPTEKMPSDLELDILLMVKTLLNDFVKMEDITYKTTDSYFAILYKNSVRKWIVRVISNESQITLIMPDENKKEIKVRVSNINDISLYQEYIIHALKRYIEPQDNTEYVYTKWGRYIKPNPYKANLSRPYQPIDK
ncbi:MAG: type I restriction enzyme HsdR N-terminal domain-containing protein [Clostridiales bacterium]|nr:type I restriction enzyme HsdR N-terminal domain-containing protein [Clostridiales bacterium]